MEMDPRSTHDTILPLERLVYADSRQYPVVSSSPFYKSRNRASEIHQPSQTYLAAKEKSPSTDAIPFGHCDFEK